MTTDILVTLVAAAVLVAATSVIVWITRPGKEVADA